MQTPPEHVRILDCAVALLPDCGFGRLQMAALLRETGLTAAEVMRIFPGTVAVERAVLRRQLDEDEWGHDRAWERARELSADPLAVCLAALGMLAAEQVPGRVPGWALAASCRVQRPDDPALRALADEGGRRLRSRLRAAFEPVAAAHPPRARFEPPSLALIAAALLEAPVAPPPAEDDGPARRLERLRALVKLAHENGRDARHA